MAKAIQLNDSGFTYGTAQLGRHGTGRGSVAQQVHDGDTVITELAGNVSVRFLGIDTPEVSFFLPDEPRNFKSIANQEWIDFLSDPLANAPGEFINSIDGDLRDHLDQIIAQGELAVNHSHHAQVAHREMEALVNDDMAVLGQDKTNFHFFLAFAHEIMDGFGRLLCYINRSQPLENIPEPRPLSYNERLLEHGVTSPYFIWPNINPFRSSGSIINAVPQAGDISAVTNDPSLDRARQAIRNARVNQQGIFEANNELLLQPFELRILARHSPPSRYVINLADQFTDQLLRPIDYHTIPNIEDRLFIPAENVPLFESKGWGIAV